MLVLPGLLSTARHLHDVGTWDRSTLIVLIPLMGVIPYLVQLCRKREDEAIRFG